MKHVFISSFLLLFLIGSLAIIIREAGREPGFGGAIRLKNRPAADGTSIQGRAEWEFNRLKDPVTGTIPEGIRRLELAFARNLPTAGWLKDENVTWTPRGPFNVGGRTRAFQLDIADETHIISGGVSGGLWNTWDGGQNWSRVATGGEITNPVALVQDSRVGKNHIWYCGTGEIWGNSASAGYSAWYVGNGIYKSVDNGQTWVLLPATSTGTPTVMDMPLDFVWNMALDASADSEEVYVACPGALYRSADGGVTWTNPLGQGDDYFADVLVTSTGVVYATLASGSVDHGIWRSTDGINFVNITPAFLGSVYNRIIIAVNPQNENEVYFFGETPGSGQVTYDWYNEASWHSLYRYEFIGGDGTGAGGNWTDLSANLPSGGTSFDRLNSQGSYDMVLKVKPDNPQILLLGGTNLYRSTDGFTSPNSTSQIGGYQEGSYIPIWSVYPNHHPDQHGLAFSPSNPNILYSSNDGGLFRTDNFLGSPVTWTNLAHGYYTTQVYTVGVIPGLTNDVVLAGFQDNGNYFTPSADPFHPWVMPLNGDGSHMGISQNGDFYCLSIQNGKTFKMTVDALGHATGFARIDPIGATGYQFINPLVLDPANNDLLYIGAGHNIFRNNQITTLPLSGNYDSISTGWFKFSTAIPNNITSMALSTQPPNILYLGTDSKHLYRIENCHLGDPVLNDQLSIQFPAAQANCVAVDPRNGNHLAVVFSNYNVYSLFYSYDGGDTWTKGAGNLEQNSYGTGNGPSLRWLSILPVGNRSLYFLGTSVGLFATDTLLGATTIWTQIAVSSIGNAVVDMVTTRPADGLVVVGTHGNGVFSARITSVEDIFPLASPLVETGQPLLSVFPNPASDLASLRIQMAGPAFARVEVLDSRGRVIRTLVNQTLSDGTHALTFPVTAFPSGAYFIQAQVGTRRFSLPFVVRH